MLGKLIRVYMSYNWSHLKFSIIGCDEKCSLHIDRESCSGWRQPYSRSWKMHFWYQRACQQIQCAFKKKRATNWTQTRAYFMTNGKVKNIIILILKKDFFSVFQIFHFFWVFWHKSLFRVFMPKVPPKGTILKQFFFFCQNLFLNLFYHSIDHGKCRWHRQLQFSRSMLTVNAVDVQIPALSSHPDYFAIAMHLKRKIYQKIIFVFQVPSSDINPSYILHTPVLTTTVQLSSDISTEVDFSPPPSYEDLVAKKDTKMEEVDWNQLPSYLEALDLEKQKN